MVFPELSLSRGVVGIRYSSFINPWIDFVVFVNKNRMHTVAQKIITGMNSYWDGEWETYMEAVENVLAGDYVILSHDSNDESEEYEKLWESMISNPEIMYIDDLL